MKLTKAIPLTEQPSIILRQGGVAITVPHQNIFFIESKGRMIETHTVEEVIVSVGQLDAIMRSLPSWFVQCHKSYIVNLRQIQRFQSDRILLKSGEAVPVSRAKYKQTKETYIDFIGESF
jgi:DNA-binding LytR/AlgR family response regulator